jgi:hypothetical protein
MKNILLILTTLTFLSSLALCNDIEKEEIQILKNETLNDKDIILELEPEIKYDENLKYSEIKSYEKSQKKKTDSNINVDVDINKETKTIDKLKLDMGTKF